MTKSIKLFFVSLCLVISLSAAQAVDYYFLYDPSCMDLLEYRYQETSAGNEFLAYGLSVSESERLILQTGSRANAREISLADPLIISCQNGQSLKNANLAKKINDNQANVYIAIPTDMEGRFKVRRVNQADYLSTSGNQLVVRTSLYRLTYNTNSNQFEGDLSNTDPRGKVYFQNQQEQGSCTTFEFLQRYDYNPQAGLLIRVNPEVGILSETNRGGASTFYALSSVNGLPVEQVLARRCGDQGVASQEGGPASYGDDNFIARGAQQASLRTNNDAQTHRVAKGETLYQISQKYQVSVEDLKRWNNKNDNLLKVNESLVVSAPANTYKTTEYQENNQPSSYGDQNFVIKGTGPSSIAAGTNQGGSDGPYATNPYEAAWLNTNGQHVVQAEETIASIARMYGYTVERFRLFNNLGETESIRPGQVLKTLDCVEPNQMRSRGSNPATGYQYDINNQGYSNQSNDPYYDPNANFEPYADYPSEFQPGNQQDVSNRSAMRSKGAPGPSSYGMPMNAQETSNETSRQYSAMDYYGPVPGSYNENRPLQEFGNDKRSAANSSFTAKGATNPGPSAYGAVPQMRSATGTNNTAGRYTDQSEQLYQRNNALQASNRQTYTVQNGDTVRSIAQKLGIDEQRLRDLNKLEKSEIVLPDQKIYIN